MMGENEQVINTNVWPEDGEYGDIIRCLHKIADIICMAAEVTSDEAKTSLFASARILIADCDRALGERTDPEEEDEE